MNGYKKGTLETSRVPKEFLLFSKMADFHHKRITTQRWFALSI
jgi:hypothetical protein